MDLQSSYNELPWPLIVSALQGELSPEETILFNEWLAASPDNMEKYARVQEIYRDGIAGYINYHEADEKQAWQALREKLAAGAAENHGTQEEKAGATIIPARRSSGITQLAIAASLILVTIGTAFWFISKTGKDIQYATAAGEQRTIALRDGSTLVLQPDTRLRVSGSYDKKTRTIAMLSGTASFVVAHEQRRPFIVEMDDASVKDIGTSFTITRSPDSISVLVSDGKIAFTEKATGETRELAAGAGIVLYTNDQRPSRLKTLAPANTAANTDSTGSLRFDNAALSTVIAALEQKFSRKILLQDTAIAQKRLTVHLDGESFDDAIKIVCASLNRVYSVDGSSGTIVIK